MAVSGLSGIESMLQQMRAVVSKAETGNLAAGEMVGQPDGFAAELQRSIRRVTAAQNAATAQAKAFNPVAGLHSSTVTALKTSTALRPEPFIA